MADANGPWNREPEPEEAGSPLRFWLWVISLAVLGGAIWKLSEMFPGQLSSDWDRYRLIQLVAILALVSAGFFFARQRRIGELVRKLAIWAGIALALLIGFAFRNELQDVGSRLRAELIPGTAIASNDEVVISASEDGHFYVYGNGDGVAVRFLIDTGASAIVLSPADAARIGIDTGRLTFNLPSQTANGVGFGATTTLDSLAVGPIRLTDVNVVVNQTDMSSSLLGMTFLRSLRSFEFRGDKLYLRPR
jgi:aspartyl protease family protein